MAVPSRELRGNVEGFIKTVCIRIWPGLHKRSIGKCHQSFGSPVQGLISNFGQTAPCSWPAGGLTTQGLETDESAIDYTNYVHQGP